jgi:hypothetical protein
MLNEENAQTSYNLFMDTFHGLYKLAKNGLIANILNRIRKA